MAFIAAKGITQLGMDDSRLQAGISASQRSLRGLQGRMQAVGKASRTFLLLGAAAVGGLVKLAGDQEKAERELTAALENTGQATSDNIARLKLFASSIQQVTTFGDEAILSIAALGINMGISAGQIEGAVKASIGLSKAFKIDLQGAMNLVARANKGQTQTLTRYGIVLDTTRSKQEQFDELLRLGAEKFALAEAEADTFRGQLAQLLGVIGDAGQALGAAFLPKVTELVAKLKEVTPELEKWAKENESLVGTLGAVGLGTAGVTFGLSKAIESIAEATIAFIGIRFALGKVSGAVGALGGTAVASFGAISSAAVLLAANIALGNEAFDKLTRAVGKFADIRVEQTAGEIFDELLFSVLKVGENAKVLRDITGEQLALDGKIAAKKKEIAEAEGGTVAAANLQVELLKLQAREQELALQRLTETRDAWIESGGAIAEIDSRIGRQRGRVAEVNAEVQKQLDLVTAMNEAQKEGAAQDERDRKIAVKMESLQERIAKIRISSLREQNTFESKRLALLEQERLALADINKLQKETAKELGTPLAGVFAELRQETSELFRQRLAGITPTMPAGARFRPEFVGVEDLFRRITTAGTERRDTQEQVNQALLERSLKMEDRIRAAAERTAAVLEERLPDDPQPTPAVVTGPS